MLTEHSITAVALILNSAEFARYHQRLADRFRPAIVRGVHSGAARAVGYLVQKTREAPPANPAGIGSGGAVNTGAFARGWRALRNPDGAELVQVMPYGPIVDRGRRPGSKFPPRDALIAWILRRLLTRPTQKRRQFGPRPTDEQQRAAADKARREKAVRGFNAETARRNREDRERDRAHPPKERERKDDRRPGGGGRRGRAMDRAAEAARLYFPIARAIARRGLRGRQILSKPEHRRDIIDFVRADVARELERENSRP